VKNKPERTKPEDEYAESMVQTSLTHKKKKRADTCLGTIGDKIRLHKQTHNDNQIRDASGSLIFTLGDDRCASIDDWGQTTIEN
jgi:hypothetical protein